MNRDPIGYAGGVNLYSYVGNNPMNGVDPSGLYYDPFDENAPDSALLSDLQFYGPTLNKFGKTGKMIGDFYGSFNPIVNAFTAFNGQKSSGDCASNEERGFATGSLIPVGAIAGVVGKARKAIVLGTEEGGVIGKLFNKLLGEVKDGGPIPTIAKNSILKEPAAFGRELQQAEQIHWTGDGLKEDSYHTLAEWDYIVKHPELHGKVIVHGFGLP